MRKIQKNDKVRIKDDNDPLCIGRVGVVKKKNKYDPVGVIGVHIPSKDVTWYYLESMLEIITDKEYEEQLILDSL